MSSDNVDSDQLSGLLDIVDVGLWRIDADTLQLCYANRQAAVWLCNPGERPIPVERWASRLHPEDRDALLELCRQVAKHGTAQAITHRALRRGGGEQWLRTTVHREADGRLVATTVDSTNAHQAEQKLQDTQARAKAMLDAIPDLMFRVTKSGTFLDFKPVSSESGALGGARRGGGGGGP